MTLAERIEQEGVSAGNWGNSDSDKRLHAIAAEVRALAALAERIEQLAERSDEVWCCAIAEDLRDIAAEVRALLTPTRAREFVAEIEGELVFWDTDGGFLPSAIEISNKDLSVWLAEHLSIPIIARGVPAEGKYGRIKLKLERLQAEPPQDP